ncbi:hypothetical protein EYF80_004719 [Liparis tanakae]|uniref:Uncharacterized protein n=1 Tax=Liparis tanakae TaxID=230148 RepID=A0A4Z2J3Z6_9TELE|nr:hypothetical protein EYF80_004719 [Liparis tanakae]
MQPLPSQPCVHHQWEGDQSSTAERGLHTVMRLCRSHSESERQPGTSQALSGSIWGGGGHLSFFWCWLDWGAIRHSSSSSTTEPVMVCVLHPNSKLVLRLPPFCSLCPVSAGSPFPPPPFYFSSHLYSFSYRYRRALNSGSRGTFLSMTPREQAGNIFPSTMSSLSFVPSCLDAYRCFWWSPLDPCGSSDGGGAGTETMRATPAIKNLTRLGRILK